MKSIILIPAYKPDKKILSNIVEQLTSFDVAKIIIVDDGSGPAFKSVFEHVKTFPQTIVLSHQINLGKGAALRTGFSHIMESSMQCQSVITVDADGQHLPEDVGQIIQSVNKHPDSLLLGVRGFKGNIPFRSLLGNKVTHMIFRGFVGKNISDTQTGLRAIPYSLLNDMMALKADRYAYELEMLLTLIQKGVPIKEIPITTVYEDNNSSSSFKPVSDSIMIYKTLLLWWFAFRFKQMLKYSISGILSTIADFGVYILLINLSCGFVVASIVARILSVIIHFSTNKYFTFSHRDVPDLQEMLKYLFVVAFNLISSIVLIYIFITYLSAGEVFAKVAAQMILFLTTYALLNGFVFLGKKRKP
jgi:putative flippase GtrA